MTRNEHLLTILAEESAEIARRAAKALRFGLAEIQPGQPMTNAQRVMEGVCDFTAVYLLLTTENSPLFSGPPHAWVEAISEKQAKVEKYLAYSKELGRLES